MGKWEIKKFSGHNNFALLKVKMQQVLTQERCIEALKGEVSMFFRQTQVEKTEMVDKVRRAIILCLRDKVLRKVDREKTAASMLEKIESLHMIKSLPHRLCLKQQLYPF